MSPDQVLEKLKSMGIGVSSVTLHHYVKWGLLEPPVTKSMGRKQGRVTVYSENAPASIYAAYMLMHGRYRLTKEHAKEIIDLGGEILFNTIGSHLELIIENHQHNLDTKKNSQASPAKTHLYFPTDKFVLQWISNILMANKQINTENIALIYLLGNEKIIGVEKTQTKRNNHSQQVSILFRHIDYNTVYIQLLEIEDYNRKFPPRQA